MERAEITVARWAEYVEVVSDAAGYVFRGQANALWSLTTSIERAAIARRHSPRTLLARESATLESFSKKFDLYSAGLERPASRVEALALLQHHGCATRLLDFSYSPYVAAHFAVNLAFDTAAIWLVNLSHLKFAAGTPTTNTDKHFREVLERVLSRAPADGFAPKVIPVNLARLSPRVAKQQAMFLAPMALNADNTLLPFWNSLLEATTSTHWSGTPLVSTTADRLRAHGLSKAYAVVKINMPAQVQLEARRQLTSMGISDETLFPGMDGLARSLSREYLEW